MPDSAVISWAVMADGDIFCFLAQMLDATKVDKWRQKANSEWYKTKSVILSTLQNSLDIAWSI